MKKYFLPVLSSLFVLSLAVSAESESMTAGEIPAARSVQEFITVDGRVDLDAVRAAGYEGVLDLGGFDVQFDPLSGLPVIRGNHSAALSDNPDDQYWERGPDYNGINGRVYALAVYDGRLIAGGSFSIACDTFACNIAAWDGSSWAPLGAGTDNSYNSGYVRALTVYNGKLIAGGYFEVAGGIAVNYIAAWDGVSWSALEGGTNGVVLALASFGDNLIAGGLFSSASGVAANNVAKWDGISWTALGTGLDNSVYALSVYDSVLVAGGHFLTAGGVSARHIAVWDGITWAPLGSDVDGDVISLVVYDNNLIVGGSFLNAGTVSANYVAAWDGASWIPLGSGTSGQVRELAVHNNTLIIGGYFLTAGGIQVNNIAAWDGESWDSLGSGSTIQIEAIASYEDMLIGGGTFQTDDGSMANNIAAWDGVSWGSLGLGSYGTIFSMAIYEDLLVAGGNFRGIDGVRADNIAAWDGATWAPLGSGVDGEVRSLAVYDNKLIVGGTFLNAGGVSSNYIASWDGTSWSSIGSGPTSSVIGLTTYAGKLIVGLTSAVYSWDGAVWINLKYPWNGDYLIQAFKINAMTDYHNQLVVGVTYGNVEKCEISTWDGDEWILRYSTRFGIIYTLGVYDDKLFVGGTMNAALLSWDGVTWTWMGNLWEDFTLFNCVTCFTVYDGKLIIGGSIERDGSIINIFAWDDSEVSFLGSGTNDCVWAMADYGKLAVGGSFTTAGDKISVSFAQWQKPDPTAVLISEFNAQPAESGIELSWVLYADERVEGYRIYRSGGGDPNEILLNERLIGAEETMYTDEAAVPGERYRYVLTVILSDGKEVRSIQVEAERAPLVARLFQNVPNPFNPSTSIRYSVPSESHVTIRVFSISGELVRTLVNRREPAGVREVAWDGRNDRGAPVSSGLYFCRLCTGKESLSKKMLLLR